MARLLDPLVRGLNHLIDGAPWAAERLRPFAGQQLRIDGAPLPLQLAVTSDGGFAVPDDAGEPAVTITLPADFAVLFVVDREKVFANARLAGSADFAEALAFVFRNLRWDVEADLAGVVGDIAAHRLVRGGQAFAAWQRQAGGNLLANVGEYVIEEKRLVAARDDITAFARDVVELRDDAERLEKRLQRLERDRAAKAR